MCHDRERRKCGSADMIVWQMSGSLDPIKPKAAGVVWINNSFVIPLFNCFNSLPCLSSITMSLNAPWDTESLVRTPTFICIPAMDNITRRINR